MRPMLMESNGEDLNGLIRRTREEEMVQETLFAVDPDWREHWWGMPAFEQKDAMPAHRITVNFICFEDLQEFAKRLGLTLTARTDSIWFPPEVIDAPSAWEYVDES